MKFSIAAVTLLSFGGRVKAAPAIFTSFATTNPDGDETGEIEKLIGTPEYFYSIVESEEDGWYPTVIDESGWPVYATVDANTGIYAPTSSKVGIDEPPEASKKLYETEAGRAAKCEASEYCKWKTESNKSQDQAAKRPSLLLSGQFKNLVIPIQFSNHASRELFPIETIADDLFNDGDYSVEDYFLQQSLGNFELISTVLPWVEISQTEAECAGNGKSGTSIAIMGCLKAAFDAAMALAEINMDEYDLDGDGFIDSLTFVHSGRGAEYGDQDNDLAHFKDRIWSHSWELTGSEFGAFEKQPYAIMSSFFGVANQELARVGIAVHEMAQMLGAPTTYGESGHGLGYWDVMSSPYGFGGDQWDCGNMAAPSKLQLGWAEKEEILENGEYLLPPAGSADTVHMISKGFPSGEYLLVEHRQPLAYDKDMRSPGGLAIYHIDETATQTKGGHSEQEEYPAQHYRVALVQADGRFDLEKHRNMGDAYDLFDGIDVNGLTPNGATVVALEAEETSHPEGYPNTKSYQGGTFRNSGVSIIEISPSSGEDDSITYKVEFGESEAAS